MVWVNYVSDCPQSNQGFTLGCTYLFTLQIKWELPGGIHNSNISSFGFLKKLETELPYDPAIPLLGIHTEETRIERDTCTPMLITALFTIARTWKQPRCPSVDEWIRRLWYIYTMKYYSAIKEHIWVSSNEVDETGAYYTEWSKPERKTPIQYTNTYIWNLERW